MRPTIEALPAVGDRRGSPGADRHICRSLRSRSRHHKAPAWRESIQGQEFKTAAFKTRTRVHQREALDDDNHERARQRAAVSAALLVPVQHEAHRVKEAGPDLTRPSRREKSLRGIWLNTSPGAKLPQQPVKVVGT